MRFESNKNRLTNNVKKLSINSFGGWLVIKCSCNNYDYRKNDMTNNIKNSKLVVLVLQHIHM
jgi:hypothetical protein